MKRLRVALPCTIALLVASPAPAAHGLTVRVAQSQVAPHLAGERVVWGEQDDRRLRVLAADEAGERATLGVVPVPAGRNAFDLAIGGGGVAISRTGWPASTIAVEPDRYSVELLNGAPLIDCRPPTGFLSIAAPAIAGDGVTLVSPGAGCRGDAVLVRTPGVLDRNVVEPGPVANLRVDGDWLAAIVVIGRDGWLVVHDLRTQREAYRVALRPPSFAVGGTPQYALDVDRDGVAVVGEPNLITVVNGAIAPGRGCELWWASPAEPRPHVVPIAGCATVALHDGVLALALREQPLQSLMTTNLAATQRTTVRRAAEIGDLDLAAGRVAWREQSCRLKTYIRTAPLRAESPRRRTGCVIRVLSRGPLRMDARGAIRVAVDCPEGCDGIVFALRCEGRRCIPEAVDVRLAAGTRKLLRLVLTPRAQRLVRRGPVRATIKTFAGHGATVAVQRTIVALGRGS